MYRNYVPALVFLLLFLLISCSKSETPTLPAASAPADTRSASVSTHLWGLWDVTIDPYHETIEATPLRGTAFTLNATKMLNSAPSSLLFENLGVELDTGIVELDVGLRHPVEEATQYTGFDVIGIFMGHGPGVYLDADGIPVVSDDTTFLTNADGYTRWFNATEFTGAGLERPIFGYVPGKFGSPACNPSAILNPYKYFADGLGRDESA